MEMPETNDDSDTLDQCMLLTNVNEDETNATCDWNLFTYDNGISLQLITMADPVTIVPVLISQHSKGAWRSGEAKRARSDN